ncbi:MAG TPA: hypothetical protein VF659_10105 [Pyrinomonadaceae bacterium]
MRSSVALACCLALALCAPAPAAGARGSREGSREEAERLWELAVAAKGGRERLHSVNSLLLTTGSRKYPLVDLYAFPGKLWRWSRLPAPFDLSVNMLNAERRAAYATSGNSPASPRRLGDDAVRGFQSFVDEAQLYFLLETRWQRPVPVAASEGEAGGRRADVVRVAVGDKQADYFLDRKTHLPLKIVFPARDNARRYFAAKDYADVGGVMLPLKVSYGGGFSPYAYVLNPDYDPNIFERPPTIDAGIEAWRRGAAR